MLMSPIGLKLQNIAYLQNRPERRIRGSTEIVGPGRLLLWRGIDADRGGGGHGEEGGCGVRYGRRRMLALALARHSDPQPKLDHNS